MREGLGTNLPTFVVRSNTYAQLASVLKEMFNVTEQETLDANLAGGVTTYLEERMPVWTSIIDTDTGLPWFTSQYVPNGQTAQGWLAGNVTAGLAVANGLARRPIQEFA